MRRVTTPPGPEVPPNTGPAQPNSVPAQPNSGPARSQPGEQASGVWADTDPLDEGWAEPKPVRHRPLWLTAGIPVVVLALLVTLVWSFGGFETRRNAVSLQEPGSVVVSGPFEFIFTGATAQPAYDEEGWKVTVIGTGRILGDEAERPRTGDNGPFVARDPKTREVQVPLTPEVGERPTEEDRAQGTYFTPGLPMVPIRLEMEFPESYEPTKYLTFIVLEQEYTDNTLTGTGEKSWNNVGSGTIMDLPVTVVPE